MTVRRAEQKDLEAVALIYEAVHDGIESGRLNTGWERGVYPTAKTSEAAFSRGELYVAEEQGKIIASAVINFRQDESYKQIVWEYGYPADEILVMHTLAVDPAFARRGTGKAFVRFYEELAASRGCKALRIDTREQNREARALYKKCGFREAGTVLCEFNGIKGVRLVLLEKKCTE